VTTPKNLVGDDTTDDTTDPARARDERLGPRDRLRQRLAELTGKELEPLRSEDVPDLEGRHERIKWVMHRMHRGNWMAADAKVLASVWGCQVAAVREYAHTAWMAVELVTGAADKLATEAATRVALRAELAEGPLAHQADVTLLQLTGALKGGRETPSMTQEEREAAIIESLRDPDEAMMRMLRAAFSNPGDGLRELLGEFAVVSTEGEER